MIDAERVRAPHYLESMHIATKENEPKPNSINPHIESNANVNVYKFGNPLVRRAH